jgi:hypothetical protein
MAIAEIESIVDWSSVFTPQLTPNIAFPADTTVNPYNSEELTVFDRFEMIKDEARVYNKLIAKDQKLLDLFGDLRPDLIVEAIRSHELYYKIGDYDSSFLGKLLGNKTAWMIASSKNIALPAPGAALATKDQMIANAQGPTFTQDGKLKIVEKIIENAPVFPNILFDNIADFSDECAEVLAHLYGAGLIWSEEAARLARRLHEYDIETKGRVTKFLETKEAQAREECLHIGRFTEFAAILKQSIL